MNIKELFDQLKEQAQELIDLGDSHEKREGYGMLRVIEAIENLPDHATSNPPVKVVGKQVTDYVKAITDKTFFKATRTKMSCGNCKHNLLSNKTEQFGFCFGCLPNMENWELKP